MKRISISIVGVSLLIIFMSFAHFGSLSSGDNESRSSNATSKGKTNFLFLKTHKTGSSTLGSIFYLYGVKRRLNFVLPPYTNTMKDVDEEFVSTLIPPRDGQTWNIQTQHCRFNRYFQHLVLPKNTTFYTSVTRSPISQFKSMFSFYGHKDRLQRQFGPNYTYDELVNIHLDQTCNSLDLEGKSEVSYGCLELNSIARDLGWSRYTENMSYLTVRDRLTLFIGMLDVELDFVMITDKMDESLVVLKNILGWDLLDILYLNKKVTEQKTSSDISLDTTRRLRAVMGLDSQIYNYFREKFETRIEEIGREKISSELEQFQVMRESFENACFDKKEGPKRVCTDCPNENLARTVSWELSQYGKTENLACAFLSTDFRLYPRAISDLMLSSEYTDLDFKYLLSNEDRDIRDLIQRMVYT